MPDATLLAEPVEDHAEGGPGAPPLETVAAGPPRLALAPYDFLQALEIERQLGVSHVLAQVLVRRGLTDAAAAQAFLEPEEDHDPSALAGIDRIVGLIDRHVAAGARITVHGDYDVDGVCATAVLVRALRARGASVGSYLPDRLADGYGLAAGTVARLAARGTDLLITVDCAITAVDEVAQARALGLDVIVTDHHAPRADGRLPDCPILHPAVCGYPHDTLCGTAVAHKLARALGAPTAAEDEELVALATVADLMPLRGENRRLVRAGLRAMANTAKPGLRALMEVSRCDPSDISAQALGFRLAPRINAAGRLRRADAGLELLLTEDRQRALEIAVELDAVNTERRAIEQRITWEAEVQVAELGPRPAYVLWADDWHPGVIGIVASRIVERHHRPTILVARSHEQPATGSGRSIPGFDLLGGLNACAGELERYGGHRAAAGMTVRRERLEAFRGAFEGHAAEVLTPDLLERTDRVDAVASGPELGLDLAEELRRLEPCGIGNPGVRLLVPGARLDDVRTMGEGRHARFTVTSGGARARGVAFGCDGNPGAPAGQPVDATFSLERNVWNGAVEPRLVLRHAHRCAAGSIDVLGEPDPYLAGVLHELDAILDAAAAPREEAARQRLDRRRESPLAVIADARAAGGDVLVLCADVPRRLPGLVSRAGGFALASYHAAESDGELVASFAHVVALDPPAGAGAAAVLERGAGFAHLAWGDAELRFAQQMHEFEYELRTWLAALYRAVKARMRVTGEELERLLRGDGEHPRPARIGGRLVRVLAELELVSLDRDLPALAIAGSQRTALEHSAAYRTYARRLEDGRRYLSSAIEMVPG